MKPDSPGSSVPKRRKSRKLLVASLGVATVQYVAACDALTTNDGLPPTSGNLVAPPPMELPPPTSGNLAPPPAPIMDAGMTPAVDAGMNPAFDAGMPDGGASDEEDAGREEDAG